MLHGIMTAQETLCTLGWVNILHDNCKVPVAMNDCAILGARVWHGLAGPCHVICAILFAISNATTGCECWAVFHVHVKLWCACLYDTD